MTDLFSALFFLAVLSFFPSDTVGGSHRNSSPPLRLLSLSPITKFLLIPSPGWQYQQPLASLLFQCELSGWKSHDQVDILLHRLLLSFLNSVPFLASSSATPASPNCTPTTPAAFSLPFPQSSFPFILLAPALPQHSALPIPSTE